MTKPLLSRRHFLGYSLGAGLFGSTAAMAQKQMAVGRMIISGFRGTRVGDPEVDRIRRYFEAGELGGVILLRRNITSPEQILALSTAFREASGPVRPIISIDQEGGRVARVDATNGFRDWGSAAAVARSGMSDADVLEYYLVRARELALVGVNLNFGPVADLNVNPANPIIGSLGRSYGTDTASVVRFARQFVQAHRAVGIKTCIKHFPGHGSSTLDSHRSSVDISSSWSAGELRPFNEIHAAGDMDSLMMSHVYHPAFSDKEGRPASLSSKGIGMVRDTVEFDGPLITDDMQMGAITGTYTFERGAVLALNAGNDFLIYSNYGKSYSIETTANVLEALKVASATNELNLAQIQAQYERAMRFLSRIS